MRLHNVILAIGCYALLSAAALAQLNGLLGGAPGGGDPKQSAHLYVVEGSRDGVLEFELTVPEGYKVYDVSEPPGGIGIPLTFKLPDPKKTKVPNGLEIVGPWSPDHKPKMVMEEGEDHPVHEGTIVFKARIKLDEGADPKSLKLKVNYKGQMCTKGVCRPIGEEVAVTYSGAIKKSAVDELPLSEKPKSDEGNAAKPTDVKPVQDKPVEKKPGADKPRALKTASAPLSYPAYSAKLYVVEGTQNGVLEFKLELAESYHVYATTNPRGGEGLPAQLTLAASEVSKGLNLIGPWTPAEAPEITFNDEGKEVQKHHGVVTWQAPVAFAEGAVPSELDVKVKFFGQMCFELCEQIQSTQVAEFAGEIDREIFAQLPIDEKSDRATVSPVAKNAKENDEPEAAASPSLVASTKVLEDLDIQGLEGRRTQYSFPTIILFALAGGFILNFMPCVLPVIGLKIASFVEQSGESSGRVIALNLFYSLGLLSVFMVLATLTSFWSFGWGQQNQSLLFNVVMVSIVFAMGLSMIGVWEIPIPGLAMSTGANKLSQKEGPQGAFFKGVLTTILAVPCSGPGLATALLYCQDKPPQVIYAVFFFLALGMAAPYLILGAFPSMVRFLPKPGAWMETFKQVMGFVLMGTVVYLMTFIPLEYLHSVVALLFGIWMACWYFGRVPAWEAASKRLAAAAVGVVIVGCVSAVSFLWLNHVMLERVEWNSIQIAEEMKTKAVATNRLPWKSYSVEKLGSLVNEQKTVMVDFTADWCPTCKVLEKFVLNTPAAKEVVEQNQIETLLADWTELDDEIADTLQKLKSNRQIPALAIFPADNPKKPIVLLGMYTQSELVQALKKAGPSKTSEQGAVAKSSAVSKKVAARAASADVAKD